MAKRRAMVVFPPELIEEPIIGNLGQQFKVVTNIRHAGVFESMGWAWRE